MSQSLVKNYLHVVYSTKDRRPFLKDKDLRSRLHAYLAGACRNLDSPSIMVGGVEDHVHILCMLSKNLAVKDFIKETKRESSKWVKTQPEWVSKFYWQAGYGAFSISPSHINAAREYIADQEEHHKKETFQDEYRRLLDKYGIEFDERYVWD